MTIWRAYASFLRGNKGLTDTEQIERNLKIATFNLKVVFGMVVLMAIIKFVRWIR